MVGRWNQAILTPDWLTKNVRSLSNQAAPNPEFQMPLTPLRVRLGFPDFYIKPEIDQLIIESRHDTSVAFGKMSQTLKEICEKLSHTPISAIGHNFTFLLNEQERLHGLDFLAIENTVKENLRNINTDVGTIARSSSQFVCGLEMQDKPYTLNLHIEHTNENARIVQFNFHYVVGETTERQSINEIIDNFERNYAVSTKALETITESRH